MYNVQQDYFLTEDTDYFYTNVIVGCFFGYFIRLFVLDIVSSHMKYNKLWIWFFSKVARQLLQETS